MSEIPIGADVVEAAAKAIAELAEKDDAYIAKVLEVETWDEHVAAAVIREALDKLGLREERSRCDCEDGEPSEPQQQFDRELLVHLIACELDKPSVYMGGPSQRSKRKAEAIMQIVERPSATSEGEPRG
jgi:hypothetical protein